MKTPAIPIEIPLSAISSTALQGIITSFIEREGTDYGAIEISHETKIRQIRRQLEEGDIKIIFDPNSDSVTLMTVRDWQKHCYKQELQL